MSLREGPVETLPPDTLSLPFPHGKGRPRQEIPALSQKIKTSPAKGHGLIGADGIHPAAPQNNFTPHPAKWNGPTPPISTLSSKTATARKTKDRPAAIPAGRSFLWTKSEILLHALRGQSVVGADGNGKVDAVLLPKIVEPVQELLHAGVLGLHAHDFGQALNKDLGDVIVACVQAADKALEHLKVVNAVFLGVHQTDLIMNVIGQLGVVLDAHHTAALILGGGVDQLDHLLGLAGALDPHDHSHHINHSFSLSTGRCLRSLVISYHFFRQIATGLCQVCEENPKRPMGLEVVRKLEILEMVKMG